jgi:23S rRNA pseudouridine1911/1915/1917 synthase
VIGDGPRGAVLWSDERIVAIDKAAGVSLATPRSSPEAAVRRLVESLGEAERGQHLLDCGPLFLVHRLDVGTSGVVLLARDEQAHRALVRAFSSHRVRKTYLALVWGRPRPAVGQMDAALGPDQVDRRRMKVDPEGRAALTRYRVRGKAPHVSLVELEPETGRTHQIRVHLAQVGHPIVGDDLYGGPRHRAVREAELRRLLAPGRPLLHAWRVHTPETECTPDLIVTAPLPADFLGALSALAIQFDGV